MKYIIAIGTFILFGSSILALKTQYPAAPEAVAKNEPKNDEIEWKKTDLRKPAIPVSAEGKTASPVAKTSKWTLLKQGEMEGNTKTKQTQPSELRTLFQGWRRNAEKRALNRKTKKELLTNSPQESLSGGKKGEPRKKTPIQRRRR